MKKLVLLSVFLLVLFTAKGQNPGNIGTANITAWFKPDNLTVGNVTSWSTTFPTGATSVTVSDNSSPYPIATNTPLNNTSNYNTTIEFIANSSFALKALQNNNSLNLLNNSNAAGQGTFFSVYYFPALSTGNNHMMLYNETGGDAIQFRNLGASGRFAIGRGINNSTNASRDWTESFLPTIISFKGNRSGTGTMTANENGGLITGGGASQSSGAIGLHFGVMPGNNNSPYNGYLNEFIFYNRDLTTLEMNKIHSYLAIKYGITLDNTVGGTQGDYLSAAGNSIWDASLTPGYHNDVIGIGRDDNQALLQKQSHSFYDITRIYLNTLETNNAANSGVFIHDTSFVMIGDNGGLTCNTLSTIAELPPFPLLNSRLEREWKVTKSNFSQPFNCDITISPCAIGIDFDTSCLALLVDDDGDFTNATAYNSANGLVFSLSGNTITVAGISNIHIPDNSTRYITLASVVLTKELPADTLKCLGNSVLIDPQNNGATYVWNDGTNSQTQNIVTPGMYWVDITANGCTVRDSILVIDQLIESSLSTSSTSICVPVRVDFTDNAIVNPGTITGWNWDFGDGNSSTSANPVHTYTAPGSYNVTFTATSSLGCTADITANNLISVYPFSVSQFSFSPGFGNPRDIISFTNLSSNSNGQKWYFGDGDSSLLPNPVHSYLEEGEYIITHIALNVNGCNDTSTATISIKNDLFFAPNSFTPNNDGINDLWGFVGLPIPEKYNLIIANRWGEIVFSSTDEMELWDGTHKGELVPSGIYIWKLSLRNSQKTNTQHSGHITVLKKDK